MATTDNRLPTEGTQIDIEARLGAIETALASLMADTTGQDIVSAISALGQTLGANKADIDGGNIANPSAFRSNIGLDINNYTIPINYSGQTGSMIVLKMGNLIVLKCTIGDGSNFSAATGNDVICNLLSDFRPMFSVYGACIFRDMGTWVSANYKQGVVNVTTNGDVYVRGKASEVQSCKYLVFSIIYLTANP